MTRSLAHSICRRSMAIRTVTGKAWIECPPTITQQTDTTQIQSSYVIILTRFWRELFEEEACADIIWEGVLTLRLWLDRGRNSIASGPAEALGRANDLTLPLSTCPLMSGWWCKDCNDLVIVLLLVLLLWVVVVVAVAVGGGCCTEICWTPSLFTVTASSTNASVSIETDVLEARRPPEPRSRSCVRRRSYEVSRCDEETHRHTVGRGDNNKRTHDA